jgi:large subunit ribosomal protein L28
MSKTCEICGKHPRSGNTISHAHNVNKRIFYPNLRSIKQVIDGTSMRIKVCMKCLKAMGKSDKK